MNTTILSPAALQEMKDVDIRTVDLDELVDLNSVEIDTTVPIHQRVDHFLNQIRNPYCFRVGDVAVKVVYQKEGPSFQQNFEDMLLSM